MQKNLFLNCTSSEVLIVRIRSIEVIFQQTAAADLSMFNTVNDNGHYKTSNGLPWGIEIILDGQYKSPREKVDMVIAYPQFQLWATSSGTENTTWYMAPVDANVLDIFE